MMIRLFTLSENFWGQVIFVRQSEKYSFAVFELFVILVVADL